MKHPCPLLLEKGDCPHYCPLLTFHANPDYALWYGWSEMVRDLSEIKEMAAELRAAKKE